MGAGMKAGEGGVLEDFRARGEGEPVSGLGASAEGLSSGDAGRHLKGTEAGGRKAPGMPQRCRLFSAARRTPS